MYATEELIREHDVIKQALKILHHISLQANAQNGLPVEHINQLLCFFTEFVGRCHYGKEENALFPAMKQMRGRDVEPIVMQGITEHHTGRNFVRGMQHACTAYQTGHPDAVATFVTHAQDYIGVLNRHLAKEETVLYPVAEQIFTITQHFQLVEAFLMVEDVQIGFDVHTEYHQTIQTLEQVYG